MATSFIHITAAQHHNKNKAVFLDRDGTINVDKGYLYKISDFEFLPDAIEGLKLLQDAGYFLIIITNQSGIARGYYSEDDFKRLNTWMLEILQHKAVHITAIYYCPHLPPIENRVENKAEYNVGYKVEYKEIPLEHLQKYRTHCNCRKPALGLFERAIRDYEIDISNSYAIGDKLRDLSICKKTNCKGFLITDYKNTKADQENKDNKGTKENIGKHAASYTAVSSLFEAARLIVGGSK